MPSSIAEQDESETLLQHTAKCIFYVSQMSSDNITLYIYMRFIQQTFPYSSIIIVKCIYAFLYLNGLVRCTLSRGGVILLRLFVWKLRYFLDIWSCKNTINKQKSYKGCGANNIICIKHNIAVKKNQELLCFVFDCELMESHMWCSIPLCVIRN